jgi:two-component system, OmpR family, sensor histidine kinase SenX3
MNSSVKERIISWAVPFVLACVLIVLANLQYHWSSEASAATRTRLRANLQISLMDFREDLNRELTTMCLELQLDGDASSRQAKILTEKLHHWERTASYPGLVASVYLWQAPRHRGPEEEDPSLLRLFPDEGRLRAIAWPSDLGRVRQLLAENAFPAPADEPPPKPAKNPLPKGAEAGVLFSPHSSFAGDHVIFPLSGLIDQSIPMLMVPASRAETDDFAAGPVLAWLLVELDANFLRSQVFPKLVSRYFGDPRTSDYGVAIVGGSTDKPQAMYSSDAGFSEYKQTPADGRLNLFGPPSPDDGPGPPRPPRSRFFRDFGRARIAHPIVDPGAGAPPPAAQRPYRMIESIRFEPVHLNPADRDWQVVVRNRKGSVEVAVQQLRRRDLAVSFGVLLILAATMALIIFTSQRARRLATLQMDFVAGISHELRTPIAAILSASENMVDGVVESKQQMIRYGGIIAAQAKRLNQLVEQVLRFSSMRAKIPNYDLRPLAVSEVIARTLENTASIVQAAGIEVECQIEANLPPVAADFEALSQCLQNLITNAVKYGGEGKWMGISAHLVRFDGRPSEIEITVKDRGIGIGREEMKQIFDPFYRSPKVSASPIHGSGLGLSLAKSFAEAIGGRISARSELGQGSAFTVHLCVATPQEQAQNAVVEMSPNSGST